MLPDKLTAWFGRPVEDYELGRAAPDYANRVYRLSSTRKTKLSAAIDAFAVGTGAEETSALILGASFDGHFATHAASLLKHAGRLPKLKGLFLGEMDQEESEISWIEQGDAAAFINAFPALEEIRIRGGGGLEWSPVRHICLRKIVIETGGLPAEVMEGILESVLPELEHLELWLGTDEYGWDGEAADTRPFLFQNPFRKLKYLGLRNSEAADDIATLAAEAPVLDQLEVFDLSLGTLRDTGGEGLLRSSKIRRLEMLDLHHHFMSDELVRRFQASGCNVNVEDQEVPDDDGDDEPYYYISVSE